MYQSYINKIEDVGKLRNLKPKTITLYQKNVSRFLNYIKKNPEELTCEDARNYLLHLQGKGNKASTLNNNNGSLVFFYKRVLGKLWDDNLVPRAINDYAVPEVLSFNDVEKREHIRRFFLRARDQGAIPIVNYNDPVSDEENRKWELSELRREGREVHECVDNDETAAVIAGLIRARILLILTSTEGIYREPGRPETLVRDVLAGNAEDLKRKVMDLQSHCVGASRAGANGAHAKLEFALGPALNGTTVIIGHGRHRITDLIYGRVPCTRIGLE